jgi:hypothetical protein
MKRVKHPKILRALATMLVIIGGLNIISMGIMLFMGSIICFEPFHMPLGDGGSFYSCGLMFSSPYFFYFVVGLIMFLLGIHLYKKIRNNTKEL